MAHDRRTRRSRAAGHGANPRTHFRPVARRHPGGAGRRHRRSRRRARSQERPSGRLRRGPSCARGLHRRDFRAWVRRAAEGGLVGGRTGSRAGRLAGDRRAAPDGGRGGRRAVQHGPLRQRERDGPQGEGPRGAVRRSERAGGAASRARRWRGGAERRADLHRRLHRRETAAQTRDPGDSRQSESVLCGIRCTGIRAH